MNIIATALVIFEAFFLSFPLVFAAYLTLSLMKIPDLSIESAYVCGAALGTQALIITSSFHPGLSALIVFTASVLGGVLVGCFSSFFTYQSRFPHLLSSILTMGIFHGLNQLFLGTSNVSVACYHNLLSFIVPMQRHPELPTLFFAFAGLALLGFLFLRTQLGTSLAVYGNNPNFFEHYGISERFVFVAGLLLSNGLAGLAGFFDTTASGFVDITMGNFKALFCVTSIILGKAIVGSKKPFSLWVPIVGSLSYFSIIQILLRVHFNLKYFTAVQSLIVAALLATRFSRQQGKTNRNDLGV